MLFNKKNQTIVYLTDTILRVYEGDSLLETLALPVKKDEMRKVLRTLFQEEIASFLQKSEVLVVLGGKLLFQKAFLLSEETVGEEDKEAFFADLPIPTEELGKNVITTEHKVYLLGTNKSYYEALLDVTKQVIAVLPLSLFSDATDVNELSNQQREDIRSGTQLYEVGNFLKDNSYKPQEAVEKEESEEVFIPHEQIVVKESSFNFSGLLKVIALSLVLAALFFTGFVLYDQQSKQKPADDKLAVVTAAPTPTPIVETVAKDELTVQILNGTGTPGQAGQVESLLTENDFTKIEVGNASQQGNQVTEVVVSKRVSEEIQSELIEILEEDFSKVELASSNEESEYDIVITTGTASE